MNYYFEDFVENYYIELLSAARNNWSIISYNDIFDETNKKVLVWRHDIDYSVHRAYRLAQLEKENGIKSVYFIQFNSMFYNVFEKEILERIRAIRLWGHEIGLHFDCECIEGVINKEILEKELYYYKDILETLLGDKVSCFSFHNPTEEIFSRFGNIEYADMINAYSDYIRQNIAYCSDSNGYWRYKRMMDALLEEKNNRMIALTHPGWWTPEVMSPRERIQRVIDGRAKRVGNQYDNQLERAHRQNVK